MFWACRWFCPEYRRRLCLEDSSRSSRSPVQLRLLSTPCATRCERAWPDNGKCVGELLVEQLPRTKSGSEPVSWLAERGTCSVAASGHKDGQEEVNLWASLDTRWYPRVPSVRSRMRWMQSWISCNCCKFSSAEKSKNRTYVSLLRITPMI